MHFKIQMIQKDSKLIKNPVYSLFRMLSSRIDLLCNIHDNTSQYSFETSKLTSFPQTSIVFGKSFKLKNFLLQIEDHTAFCHSLQ